MSSDRSALRAAQKAILASGGETGSASSLCAPCLTVLPVTGISVSTLNGSNNDTICSSDDVAYRIDELQFDLGEGPCWQALASRQPVLVPDIQGGPHPEWPIFAHAVLDTPAKAIFAFPLFVGVAGIGALDLYSTNAGQLADGAVRDAKALAATISTELLRRILGADAEHGADLDPWRSWPSDRRQIHQATGMLIDQLDLPVDAAFARLRAHAFSTGSTVAQVARDVVSGKLRFGQDEK